jgi:probable HAF family extracellular repeat protein
VETAFKFSYLKEAKGMIWTAKADRIYLTVMGLMVISGASVQAQTFTATNLGTLGAASGTVAYGINNSGQVVGLSGTGQPVCGTCAFYYLQQIYGFLWSNGIMTSLGTPSGLNSVAYGINNSGQVVGNYNIPGPYGQFSGSFFYSGGTNVILKAGGSATAVNNSGQIAGSAGNAFLYNAGVFTDLGTLGGSGSTATAVNDSGQVAGYSSISGNSATHSFLWNGAAMADLGTLGGTNSQALGINQSGLVVGFSQLPGNAASHAFLYSAGALTDLGTLGGINSQADGINAAGEAVGWANTQSGAQDGFLWNNGAIRDINSLVTLPGVSLLEATAINDLGQIVANGSDGFAYLLTPTAPTTGTINVTTNLSAASFTITGPVTYQGGGTSFAVNNGPAGAYTISYDSVQGNLSPQPETKTLLPGGHIEFTGTYTPALIVTPLNLTFNYQKDVSGPIQPQLVILSSTGQDVPFSISIATNPPNGAWLAVSRINGITPAQLGLSVMAGLPAGSYGASIGISAAGALNPNTSVPVQLTVTENARAPVTVHSSPCTDDICVSFQPVHGNNDRNKAIGVLNITNLTGAWYELKVDFSQTTANFGKQAPPVILLAPYGSFVTSPDKPVELKNGDVLQLVVNKDEIDAMGMFLIDLTLRAFFGVSFPTSNQELLDFRLGSIPAFLDTIEGTCAGSISSTTLSLSQHDTFGVLTGAADMAGCIASNPGAQTGVINLIKSLYNDTAGILAHKWLTIAGNALQRVVLIVGNAPKVLELLGSEFVAADLTALRLQATQ